MYMYMNIYIYRTPLTRRCTNGGGAAATAACLPACAAYQTGVSSKKVEPCTPSLDKSIRSAPTATFACVVWLTMSLTDTDVTLSALFRGQRVPKGSSSTPSADGETETTSTASVLFGCGFAQTW